MFNRKEVELTAKLDRLLDGEQLELPAGLLEEKVWQVLRVLEQSEQKSKVERDSVLTLMSDISHQLKTPLASLTLHLDLAEDSGITDDERAAFLAECKNQVRNISRLTESLLKIARLETGLIAVIKAPADIVQTVQEAVSAVKAQAIAKGLTVTLNLPEALDAAHDALWTKEALCNILDNAVKYTECGGITVTLEQGPIYTRIDIADTGIGLAPEQYTKVFSRFYRVRNSEHNSEHVEGTGLGLTIAREIMRQQGGNITVASDPGKGATFSVFFQKE